MSEIIEFYSCLWSSGWKLYWKGRLLVILITIILPIAMLWGAFSLGAKFG
jgi:hypothetical protein